MDSSVRWLWQVTGRKKGYVLALTLIQGASGGLGVLYALLLRNIVDSAAGHDSGAFWHHVALIVALVVLQIGLSQAGVSNGSLFTGTGSRYGGGVQTLHLFLLRIRSEGQHTECRNQKAFFHFLTTVSTVSSSKGIISEIRDFFFNDWGTNPPHFVPNNLNFTPN